MAQKWNTKNRVNNKIMKTEKIMWCVFCPKGNPLECTLDHTEYMAERCMNDWANKKEQGYTCRKVKVTIEDINENL